MTRDSRSIIVAMGCGAFVGAIVIQVIGLSAGYHNLWSAGALLGGFIAYILDDPAHFRAGVRRGWTQAWAEFGEMYQGVSEWHPDRRYWLLLSSVFKLVLLNMAVSTIAAAAMIGTILGAVFGVIEVYHEGSRAFVQIVSSLDSLKRGAVVWLCVSLACGFYVAGLSMATNSGKSWHKQRAKIRMMISVMRTGAIYGNPIGLLVLLYKGLVLAVPYAKLASRIAWAAVRCSARFLGYSIAYVHSTRRIICMVDTALVLAVCYVSLGSVMAVLVSTIMGPVIGLVNYWVIAPRLERLQMTGATS